MHKKNTGKDCDKRDNNNDNSIYLNTIKKFSKADVVVCITIKLNFLTNHNKTIIRILRIYNNNNSTQYIIIIYVA